MVRTFIADVSMPPVHGSFTIPRRDAKNRVFRARALSAIGQQSID